MHLFLLCRGIITVYVAADYQGLGGSSVVRMGGCERRRGWMILKAQDSLCNVLMLIEVKVHLDISLKFIMAFFPPSHQTRDLTAEVYDFTHSSALSLARLRVLVRSPRSAFTFTSSVCEPVCLHLHAKNESQIAFNKPQNAKEGEACVLREIKPGNANRVVANYKDGRKDQRGDIPSPK